MFIAFGVIIALIGSAYRRTRIQARQCPWDEEKQERFRVAIAHLPRLEQPFAHDRLRAQEDWTYAQRRERFYFALAAVLFIVALTLVGVGLAS